MSRSRLLTWLAAVLSALSLVSSARAQKILPFIEPDAFKPDYQFFAPAEMDDYDGGPPAKTGFFFEYQRLYMAVSRPEGEASSGGNPTFATSTSFWDSDWSWGNRFEFGYMTEDQRGWLMTVTHVDGPNETFPLLQESLNRWLQQGALGTGGTGQNANPALLPEFTNRTRTFDPALLDLQNSINVADYASVTLEKVCRRDTFHNGGVLETMLGGRFMRFNDYYQRDSFPFGNFGRFANMPDGSPSPNFPNFVVPNGEGPWEVFDHRITQTENFMLGGQLGLRYLQTAGHWRTTIDVRAFACQNWVNQVTTVDRYNLRWATIGTDTDPGDGQDLILTQRANPVFDRASEFVFGGEVRGQAAYSLTRDITLSIGFSFIDLGKGITRGSNLDRSHQDVQMGSVDFGFAVNR
jgi:hypothetical protein